MADKAAGATIDSPSATTTTTAGADANADATKPNPSDGGADASLIADGADKGGGKLGPDGKPITEAPKGAPEKYEPFKLPEGYVPDDTANKSFSEWAKAANLSQEQAQKAVDLYAQMMTQNAKAMNDTFVQMKKEWYDESIKGLGAQKDATLALVSKARDAFLSKESIQFLKDSGGDVYLPLIRDLEKIGKAIAEDTVVDGGKGAGGDKTAAEVLYPNQGKK